MKIYVFVNLLKYQNSINLNKKPKNKFYFQYIFYKDPILLNFYINSLHKRFLYQ